MLNHKSYHVIEKDSLSMARASIFKKKHIFNKLEVGGSNLKNNFDLTPNKITTFILLFALIGALIGVAVLVISRASGYPKGPGGTYSDWYFPDPGNGYDSLEWDITSEALPNRPAVPWQFTHYYAMNFSFVNGEGGYTGFQDYAEPTRLRPTTGKTINYSIWNTQNLGGQSPDQSQPFAGEGTGWQTRISYDFLTGRTYTMRLALGPNGRESTGTWWGVTITDKSTGSSQLVGQIKVPPTWGKLKPSSSLFGEDANWNLTASGSVTETDCSKFLTSTLSVDNILMNGSVRPASVSNTISSGTISQPDGQFIKVSTESCPASSSTINESTKGVRHVVNLGGTSGVVAPTATCDTSTEGVYLFVDANYQGRCSKLTADARSYTNLTIGGDTASSIRIVGNWRATLYRDPDFMGISSIYTTDDPSLGDEPIGNDQVSSVKVEKLGTATTQPSQTTTSSSAASFVSQTAPPSTMRTGQSATVQVIFRNTGTATWTSGTNFLLGSQNPQDNGNWSRSRVALSSDIAPGQNATFNFTITAPSTPGSYNFQWQMLQERVRWFGDKTPNVPVTVTTSPSAPGSQSTAESVITLRTRQAGSDGKYRCLDVQGGEGATQNGARLQVWDCAGVTNQQFKAVPIPGKSGTYQLRPMYAQDKCLSVANYDDYNGGMLHQWGCGLISEPRQQWILTYADSSRTSVNIRTVYGSQKMMDVSWGADGPPANNGDIVHEWQLHNAANQQWNILPIQGSIIAN